MLPVLLLLLPLRPSTQLLPSLSAAGKVMSCHCCPSLSPNPCAAGKLQATAWEAVSPEKPRLKCSATSQLSKAEYSKLVATPPRMRPTISTPKFGECLVTQLAL